MSKKDTRKSFSEPTEVKFNDFEPEKFGDIEVDEVFWINDKRDGNQNEIWRKLDMEGSVTNAVNLRTGEERQFSQQEQIWVRI